MNRYLLECHPDQALWRRACAVVVASALAIPVALIAWPAPAAAQVMDDDACPRFAVDHASFATCDGDRVARADGAMPAGIGIAPRAAFALKQSRQAFLIDVRAPQVVAASGTPFGTDAVVSALDAHDTDGVAPSFVPRVAALVRAAGGDQDSIMLLICTDGRLADLSVAALRAEGFARAYGVLGGIAGSSAGPGWIKSGLPMVTADPSRLVSQLD